MYFLTYLFHLNSSIFVHLYNKGTILAQQNPFYKFNLLKFIKRSVDMNDFKIHLYKNQQQYLAKLLPTGYSFQLYKVRKNISDYHYIQFDKKLKKQQSIILSRKQSLSKSNKQSLENPFQLESKIEKNQLVKQEQYSQIQQKCFSLLKKLRKHQSSYPFRSPVDTKFLQVPEYETIVLDPIDLKTMDQNVKKNKYDHLGQIQRDIYKMIMNSYKFNQKESNVFQKTMIFQEYFVSLLNDKNNQIPVQRDFLPQALEQTILNEQNNVQKKLHLSQDVKYQHQGDQYSNMNFNKLMSQYESRADQQFSQPQISSSNKISASQVQKSMSSLIRRLNMHPLSKIKKSKLTTKFTLFQTNMPLGQKRRLFQKIFKLRQQDHMHVIQMLTRNRKSILNDSEFQIDLQKVDSKVLREIQNFIVLRTQSAQANLNNQHKSKRIQKKKKLKKKSSKRTLQDQSYHSSQATKIKLKFSPQDDEYLPQNQISEEMINQSLQVDDKSSKYQIELQQSLQQHEREIVEQENTPNHNNTSNNFIEYHGMHNQESNNLLQHSNHRIRQSIDPLEPMDQIDLYFNTSQEEQVRKFLWDQ